MDFSENSQTLEARLKYGKIYEFFKKLQFFAKVCKFPLVITVIVINLFHLIILSQKSMRSNAISVLLIGIAISDVIFLNYYFSLGILNIMKPKISPECIPPGPWLHSLLYWIVSYSSDTFRRVSSWLGVIMALIRALSIRYPTNQCIKKFRTPSRSCKIILSLSLISFLISSLQWAWWHIEEIELWTPPESCSMYPFNTSYRMYALIRGDKLIIYDQLISKMFLLIDGISLLAPPILYPFLTGLLIFELKMAKNRRRNLINRTDKHSDKKNDNTTKLVIFMTFSYFFAEASIGSLLVMNFGLYKDTAASILFTTIIDSCVLLLYLHFGSNSFFCFLLNSEYRDTVKSIFCCADKKAQSARKARITPT